MFLLCHTFYSIWIIMKILTPLLKVLYDALLKECVATHSISPKPAINTHNIWFVMWHYCSLTSWIKMKSPTLYLLNVTITIFIYSCLIIFFHSSEGVRFNGTWNEHQMGCITQLHLNIPDSFIMSFIMFPCSLTSHECPMIKQVRRCQHTEQSVDVWICAVFHFIKVIHFL